MPIKLKGPFWLLATILLTTTYSSEAQQPKQIPRIGILTGASVSTTPLFEAFRRGLKDLGYEEGRNITLDFRLAKGEFDRFPALAAELVQLNVDVIITDGGNTAPSAARNATRIIPIVMAVSGDPVKGGLIASFARPGGNVTGLTLLATELSGKRVELFKEAVTQARRLAVLRNRANFSSDDYFREAQMAAQTLGVKTQLVDVQNPADLTPSLKSLLPNLPHGLMSLPDAMLWNNRRTIIDFSNKQRIPTIFPEREFTDDGGLMAYGPNVADNFRRAATFVDKILKGAKPADLPVEQPTKFEFIINLKTAKQIGLTIPPNVLARADKVIK
jgi:putative tryptophan/tyrosine transport system substrate-binding protein